MRGWSRGSSQSLANYLTAQDADGARTFPTASRPTATLDRADAPVPARRRLRAHRRPAAGDRLARRWDRGRRAGDDAARRDRYRQDDDDGGDDRGGAAPVARDRAQQD